MIALFPNLSQRNYNQGSSIGEEPARGDGPGTRGCDMACRFRIHLKRPEGRAVLHVEGDLDLASAEMMELFLQEAQDSPGLVVDVRGVDCADSSGIRVLVESARRLEDHGYDLRVTGAGPRVARAFSVLGLDKFLDSPPELEPPASRQDRHSGHRDRHS